MPENRNAGREISYINVQNRRGENVGHRRSPEAERRRREADMARRRAKKRRALLAGCTAVTACAAAVFFLIDGEMGKRDAKEKGSGTYTEAMQKSADVGSTLDAIAEDLQSLLEKNPEAKDFVEGYGERERYIGQPIDLTQDVTEGEVPLLMQWDKRWGYDACGNSIVGLSGCGPTCMAMACIYFTGDTRINPRTVAEFAGENGYLASGGTGWDFWTTGAKDLGLAGEELPLDENRMKRALDAGKLIVCSMRPGDFTTTGHFILIRGYDENGFFVNDPNRLSNSEKQWNYEELKGQIKNLWSLGPQEST